MTIKGTIESLQYSDVKGHEKIICTIVPNHTQRAFVEFRGKKMDLLKRFKENDEIVVFVSLEGKVSKASGILFNNLVVQELL